jgi:hypothetical protein
MPQVAHEVHEWQFAGWGSKYSAPIGKAAMATAAVTAATHIHCRRYGMGLMDTLSGETGGKQEVPGGWNTICQQNPIRPKTTARKQESENELEAAGLGCMTLTM